MWDSGLKWFDRKNRKLVDANLTMENGKISITPKSTTL